MVTPAGMPLDIDTLFPFRKRPKDHAKGNADAPGHLNRITRVNVP